MGFAYEFGEPFSILTDDLDDLLNISEVLLKLLTGPSSVIGLGSFSLLLRTVDFSSEIMSSDLQGFKQLVQSTNS
jgi:hypothetical protein